jgi:hypothetical protein
MALTAAQTAYLETRLGTMDAATAADVEVRLARLGGDGYEAAAAAEVLETRLATMLQNPLKFAIPGDYSEDRSSNVSEVRRQLELALAESGSAEATGIAVPVQPADRRWSRDLSYPWGR